MLNRISLLFPLVLSLVAFILTILALFAGHKDGFMEEYAIARLNTSMLGHNMLNVGDGTANTTKDGDKDKGLLDKARNKWNDIKEDIKEDINKFQGEIADELASKLGISEWYSLHVMDACMGQYKPNATAPGAGLNTTNCTDSDPNYRFNLTEILDHELKVGPFSLNLADINWPDDIQDSLNMVNDALLGLFILYVLGVGFSGLAILGSIAAFFLHERRSVALVNVGLSTLAALCITIGSILVTVAAKKGVSKISKLGDNVGVSATVGNRFLAITWAAAGVMLGAMVYWVAQLCILHREKKKRWTPRHKKEAY